MKDRSAVSIEHSDFQTAGPANHWHLPPPPPPAQSNLGFEDFSSTIRREVTELRFTRKAVFLSIIISFLKGLPSSHHIFLFWCSFQGINILPDNTGRGSHNHFQHWRAQRGALSSSTHTHTQKCIYFYPVFSSTHGILIQQHLIKRTLVRKFEDLDLS